MVWFSELEKRVYDENVQNNNSDIYSNAQCNLNVNRFMLILTSI